MAVEHLTIKSKAITCNVHGLEITEGSSFIYTMANIWPQDRVEMTRQGGGYLSLPGERHQQEQDLPLSVTALKLRWSLIISAVQGVI